MKPKNTGTILDKYPTWKAFISDPSVSSEQLRELLANPCYYRGTARAVSRHVNFNRDVFSSLKDSKHRFLRSLAYFNRTLSWVEIVETGLMILRDNTLAPSLKHRAVREVYHAIGDGSVNTKKYIHTIFQLPVDHYCDKLRSDIACDAFDILERLLNRLHVIN